MRRAHVPILAGVLVIPALALADEKTDNADIVAARKFVEPVMGKVCAFASDEKGLPEGYNNVFHLTYRTKGQDQDSPDYKRTLVQLSCSSGAYNFNSIYLLRNDDEGEGGWELLSFAEPRTDFDYADEEFTKLKAPPKVTGFIAVTELTNSDYDQNTRTITATAKWRGIGDAWSGGDWRFEEGVFVLKRYEMDPTYQAPDADAEDTNAPESYVVFGDPQPPQPEE